MGEAPLQFDDPYYSIKQMLTHLRLLDLLHVFTSNAIRVSLIFLFTKAKKSSVILLPIKSLFYFLSLIVSTTFDFRMQH